MSTEGIPLEFGNSIFTPSPDTPSTGPKWPERLSRAALHGLAGEYVHLVSPASETDEVALLLQFLVAAGNLIGHGAFYVVEDTVHHLNLFTVLVGMTSKSRKGTSWNRVKRTCGQVDEAWVSHSLSSGLSSGEGLIEAVRDPSEEDDGVADKRLLIQQGEFCSVLRMMERDGNTLSMVLRDAWDGVALRTMTRKANSLRSSDAHISLVGHITIDELRAGLAETDKANGFANRILWACVARSKELPDEVEVDGRAMVALAARFKQAVEYARGMGSMRRTGEAQEIWREVYHDLSMGHPGMFGAITSRSEAQVIRLSCLFAALDKSTTVAPEHLLAGLEVWRFCEDSCRYIFGDRLGDPVADAIFNALKVGPMSQTEISGLFGRNKPAAQITRAISMLQERGLIDYRKEPTEGRDAVIWFVLTKETKKTK